MPIYEYQAKDESISCDHCRYIFEVLHGMNESLQECPECKAPLEKLISICNGFTRKQPNQYSEVLKFPYWRDQNGVRHRVTPADGHAKSASVPTTRTVPQEVVEARKAKDAQKSRARRLRGQF